MKALHPTITVTDPGNIEDVVPTAKIGNGALANPNVYKQRW